MKNVLIFLQFNIRNVHKKNSQILVLSFLLPCFTSTQVSTFMFYSPDTYRVISTEAENAHCNFQPVFYGASFEPPDEELCHNNGISCQLTRVMPKPLPDYRFNKPHSKLCTFIRTNVLLFNDPICQVSVIFVSFLFICIHPFGQQSYW